MVDCPWSCQPPKITSGKHWKFIQDATKEPPPIPPKKAKDKTKTKQQHSHTAGFIIRKKEKSCKPMRILRPRPKLAKKNKEANVKFQYTTMIRQESRENILWRGQKKWHFLKGVWLFPSAVKITQNKKKKRNITPTIKHCGGSIG